MTKTQYSIFGMLLAAAGLHIWLDKNAQSSFKQFLTITPSNWKQIGSATIAAYLLWFVGLAAILLLSDWAPRVALWIAALILVGALLINANPIVGWIQTASQAISKTATPAGVQPGQNPS